ncbi:MAG: NAD(P)-binding protein [Clostridia bacterium]|nr:NAD(P)-binding protein [Clostridia bacterium]
MEVLKKEIPTIWTTGWTDIMNTGTWRSAMPIYQKRKSPCQDICPVNGEIPTWLQNLKSENLEEAWLEIVAKNPFPAVTGRVCHHPCESKCNRKEYDGEVGINSLEQFLGDLAIEKGWSLPKPSQEMEERVAVIGGGPAGLSCAYQLRKAGYQVTIFEEQPELGGLLRFAIPEYRLPKAVLAKELERLLELGFNVELNRKIITKEDFEQLRREYSAVFVAVGAYKAKSLPQLENTAMKVWFCLDFLAQVKKGEKPDIGRKVVVIGGGNAAIDSARTALRLGAKVKVLSLEDRADLPAINTEVVDGEREGIIYYHGAMVTGVEPIGTDSYMLKCVKVVFKPSDTDRFPKTVVLKDTEFELQADSVILAIGQEPDTTPFPSELVSAVGLLGSGLMENQGLFVGGDSSSLNRYVSAAIADGKNQASKIIEYMKGNKGASEGNQNEQVNQTVDSEPVKFSEVNTFYFPIMPKVNREIRSESNSLSGFAEIKAGLSQAEAIQESSRCFSCGHCISCNNCFYFCPDQAVVKNSDLCGEYHILEQYCKGCGLCVEECPRGAVTLKEEAR